MNDRPNILFLMTDQHRWDALGCVAGWVQTPHLDRLASEGVRFTGCIATSPECIPARVSLASGLYPHNTGVWDNIAYTLPAGTPTWMRAIQAGGYRTSFFGKSHWHPHRGDIRSRENLMKEYGFDDVNEVPGPRTSMHCLSHMTAGWQAKGLWDEFKRDLTERIQTNPFLVRPSTLPLQEYYDVYVGQQAVDYLQKYQRDQPWFCWVSFPGPHAPWDAPEPYASMYDPAAMPLPIPPTSDQDKTASSNVLRRRTKATGLAVWDIQQMRANYAGKVSLIDDQVGQIVETVQHRRELDRTIIIFTSDHGEMNGDHGLIYKSNFYRSAVSVPLLIRLPGPMGDAVAGKTCSNLVESFDIGPTLVDLVGGKLAFQQFGRSLVPYLRSGADKGRSVAISEFLGEIMIMDHVWKAAINPDGTVYQLFQVQDDPDELTNLAGRPEVAEVETELRLRAFRQVLQTQMDLGRKI